MLALVLVLTTGTAAFAAATSGINSNTTGKITVDNAVDGQTYTIYQILQLESYDTDAEGGEGAYSYKATDAWKNFVTQEGVKDTYLITDDNGYVRWNSETTGTEAQFAELAKAYAATLEENEGSAQAENGTVEFTNLNLGYYLVDSTLGALASLDTTDNEVTIKEKNAGPTVEKEVKEGESWGESNTASIGDTVEFMATINVIDGQPKDYVMHDTMTDGLTFNPNSVKVFLNSSTEALDSSKYTVSTSVTHEGNPSVTHTFDLAFGENVLKPNDVVVVTYSATLNDKAVIYTNSNNNTVKLSYKDTNNETHNTEEDTTKTYTFSFDLVKTNESNVVIDGAQFELYDAKTDGNKIALVNAGDGVYRVATEDEKSASGFTSAVIDAGKVTIKGLDAGTYYLQETKAPEGFNILNGRVAVTITNANLDATTTTSGEGDAATITWTSGGAHVVNKTGAELPSTGGMGTTIFYAVGSILLVGAGVLLVTKKRMSSKQ